MASLERLQSLATAHYVAALFEKSYDELSKIIYRTPEKYRYRVFTIPKKSGGLRTIASPSRKILKIQRCLSALLQDIYQPPPSSHGFVRDRSIVSNAERHLRKKFIFNVDLEGFFDSLTFGRVKGFFMAKPFGIPKEPATVLAHICCFQKRLPQGAPTSPIITNLVCRKMDRQLQILALKNHATYTRYADDLTFSFTREKSNLPRAIVSFTDALPGPGIGLEEIIRGNGFKFNETKTRLHPKNQRLEVTGLVVNEFVNVHRKFIRRTASMLYAWETFGLAMAEKDYLNKYTNLIRSYASNHQPQFDEVVKGRLAFLHMVRGRRDSIYIKLAKRFNELSGDKTTPLPYVEPSEYERSLSKAIYVIEVFIDDDGVKQGTGFFLKDVGFVTAAHVVSDKKGGAYRNIEVYSPRNSGEKFKLEIQELDLHRDLAIGKLLATEEIFFPPTQQLSAKISPANQRDNITLWGFPGHKVGHTDPYIDEGKIGRVYSHHGVKMYDISAQIREGNSGGPFLGASYEVIGVAVKGAEGIRGSNSVVAISELFDLVKSKK
ncbi:MAG: reverse transcriptase domain-containing protein [Nitrospirales bacterium]